MSDDDPVIEAAIAELEAQDPGAAREAEAALEWLTAGEGLEVLTQERLQRFLWYELPMKWLTDPDHHRRVVAALARALDLLELPRYAAICRSATTAGVLDAYERSDREGKKAFLRADAASGISPPDLPELAWGSVMGWEESRALSSTAELLELAIASGELVPGARGWKARQQELVRVHVSTPRIELAGRTFLDVVQAERLQAWLERRRSQTRRRIIEPIANRFRGPILLPAGTDDPLPPLRWLMEQLADGQALTQARNLNRAFVQDAARRFGWWNLELHGLPRGEDELYDLRQTRHLAQHLGLTRQSGRKLALTTKGRSLLGDPERLWRAAAHAIVPDNPFGRATGEVALSLLATVDSVGYTELNTAVAEVVREEGWRDQRTHEPVDERSIPRSMHETINLLRALNLLSIGGDWLDRRYGLTEVGRTTALEALHHAATGPRSNPFD